MLAGKIGREVTLRNALRDLKRQQDMILIDCPPTLGLLTVNALVAADHAILSTEAQYFSLQGVEQAMEVLDLARDSLNPELELLGVVLNIANMRTRHARQTLEALRERFGDKLFRTVIRQSIAYAESAERAIPILDYRPDRGADYLSLAGELLRRLGQAGAARSPARPSSSRRGWCPSAAASGRPGSERGRTRRFARSARGDDRPLQRGLERPRPRRDHGHARTGHGVREPHRRRACRGRGGARATSARSSRPGPTSASRRGGSTSATGSWSRSGRRPPPTRTRCAAATGRRADRQDGHLGRPRRDPVRGRAGQAQGRLLGLGLDPAPARRCI